MRIESKLLIVILVNALSLIAGWRLSRRWGWRDPIQQLLDMFLLWYVWQYATVAVLGLVGQLSPQPLMIGMVLVAVAALLLGRRERGKQKLPARSLTSAERFFLLGSGCFVAGFAIALVYFLSTSPVLSTDGLAYHMPTVVGWMQSKSLAVQQVWYWNPANSYSPQAAGTFIAWLMIPLRSDVLARFVQVGPLLMIFLAVTQLARQAGATLWTAAACAAASVLVRPLLGQSVIVKDDLFVTAFFLTAVVSLLLPYANDRLAWWRLGSAVGLIAASKYTALFALPALLIVIDSPWRGGWRWKKWLAASAVAAVLAGPWYLRNLLVSGNPLYPLEMKVAGIRLLPGLFTVARDSTLLTRGGIWKMMTEGYYGLPIPMAVVMIAGWMAAIASQGKRVRTNSAVRFAVFATPLGLILFVLFSPLPEVRYFFPFYPPMFVAYAIACTALRPAILGDAMGIAIAALSAATSFTAARWHDIGIFAASGLILAAVVVGVMWLWHARLIPPLAGWASGLLLVVGLGMYVYVHFGAYAAECQQAAIPFWTSEYGALGDGWAFVRDEKNIPPESTVAYANTYLIYPLYGPALDRKVIYAPVRKGISTFADLPPMGEKLDASELANIVTRAMNQDADYASWLANLHRGGAQWLFVAKRQILTDPPEERMAREHPQAFESVFDNDDVAIYRIR